MPPFASCLTCSCPTHVFIVLDLHRASFRGFLEEIVKVGKPRE